jgi:2-polyprenyl-6-methoxyphenol hydroxylase-like FAD-dependent oxidoreductase
MRRALIVGAGIGGLAAGIALRRAGWDIRIFERAPVPREIGFGVGLAPNAIAALRELGVADTVLPHAVAPVRGEIRQPDGTLIRRASADPKRFRNGTVLWMIQRPALHGGLLQAVGPEHINGGCQADRFESDGRSVTVHFTNGTSATGDILIGADGVSSALRAQLHPHEPPPRPSGYFAFRGTSHAVSALGDNDGIWYLGPGLECGAVRSGPDTVYWFLGLFADDVRSAPYDVVTLRDRIIARLDSQFRRIAEPSAVDQMRLDELFERPPLMEWGRDRVTLLGDAAHPVLPHTGQGAAQALEDAVGLGRALANNADAIVALRRYGEVRSRRAAAIIRSGPRIARITTTRNPVVTAIRNSAIRLMPVTVVKILLMRPAFNPNRPLGPPLQMLDT